MHLIISTDGLTSMQRDCCPSSSLYQNRLNRLLIRTFSPLSTEESDGMTDDIIVSVKTTVIADMILCGSAWVYKKFNIKSKGGLVTEGGIEENVRAPRV